MKRTPKKWIRNPSDDLAIAQGCYFDESRGKFVCDFIESFCYQSKGRWVGQLIKLLDWQRDFLMRLYGWRRAGGQRRFRSFYLEVAKKNGKSTLVSCLSVVHIVDQEDGAPEIYLNAVDREQAGIVFDECARMVAASPELTERLQTIKSKGRIVDPVGNGKIQKNSADAPSKDGVNASFTVFDEIHRFKNRDLWDVFKFAGASREQPLRGVITTAGEEEEGVWFDERTKSEQINAGAIPSTDHLGVVYRADPSDDLESPETWRKANPSLGSTISEEDFRVDLEEAKRTPREWANFLRLRLNIITGADAKFIDMANWNACNGQSYVDPGSDCWMGLDLSSNQDLTALACVFGDLNDTVRVLMRFWLPKENIVALEREHQVPYRTWAEMGLITLTRGNVVDKPTVRKEINALAKQYNLIKLLVDPWNAADLNSQLAEDDGLPVEEIRQGFSLSPPTKALQALVLSTRLHHGDHPILRWHASNAIAVTDENDNFKLSKKKSRKKIDGMAALVNAIAAMSSSPSDGPSVYEKRGLIYL